MKLVKMSLAAAVLVGASAFAVDNVKVSGNAQVFYSTSDAKGQTTNVIKGNTGSGTLFDKDSSAADAGLNLNISADLAKNSLVSVSAGAGYTVLSTLGLENNMVSNVWGSSHAATPGTGASYASSPFNGAKVENANWMNEAWVAVSLNAVSKSTVKVGRMELDTPLAFTEKWSIEKNTFEAAVLINQDLPDTTIVAAYVGNGNGTETFGQDLSSNTVIVNSLAVAPLVNQNGQFTTYGKNGAYAAGIINNSFKPLTAQAWYYDVSKMAQAYWLQADLDASSLGLVGLTAGAQYTGLDLTDFAGTSLTTSAYALQLGYSMKDMFAAKVSYSSVDKDHSAAFNTATAMGTAQTKLYTEAWWNYGQVTAADTQSLNVTVTSPVAGLFDAALYVTSVDHKTGNDLTEVTVTATKKFGPLDATLAYINTDFAGNGVDSNTVQAYLTLNF